MDEKIICPTCQREFKSQLGLKQHTTLKHLDPNHFCPVCDRGFFLKAGLTRHLKNPPVIHKRLLAERGENLAPKIPEIELTPKTDLVEIESIREVYPKDYPNAKELNLYPFKCAKCPCEFSRKWNLQEHIRRKHT